MGQVGTVDSRWTIWRVDAGGPTAPQASGWSWARRMVREVGAARITWTRGVSATWTMRIGVGSRGEGGVTLGGSGLRKKKLRNAILAVQRTRINVRSSEGSMRGTIPFPTISRKGPVSVYEADPSEIFVLRGLPFLHIDSLHLRVEQSTQRPGLTSIHEAPRLGNLAVHQRC